MDKPTPEQLLCIARRDGADWTKYRDELLKKAQAHTTNREIYLAYARSFTEAIERNERYIAKKPKETEQMELW
jgi:hypothetical protein